MKGAVGKRLSAGVDVPVEPRACRGREGGREGAQDTEKRGEQEVGEGRGGEEKGWRKKRRK